MARSTGPMLTVTGISFANQWLGNGQFDMKILIGGGIAALMLAGLERTGQAGSEIAVGIAWIAFVTLMFTKVSGQASPWENLKKLTGI